MKIGIISINAHTKVLNFASPLHSVAFQQFLADHGIESKIIDYKPVYYKKYDVRHPLFYYIDHPRKEPEHQKYLLSKWKNLFYEREKRYDLFEEFIRTHYKKTKSCHTAAKLDEKDLGFDLYICVTDVIWKWNKDFGFDRGFFLDCRSMDGKKKIAYAASRGATTYTGPQQDEFLRMIADFDYISVRERSFKDYIDALTGLAVSHVLDPVFLQPPSFYQKLERVPEEKNRPSGGFVLLYIVMEKNLDIIDTAVKMAAEQDLEVIELSDYYENAEYPKGTHHKIVYDIGIEEWLWYLSHAQMIYTNSFHACCFSILMHRQFFAGARGGDKIDSLLALFELDGRRVRTREELAESLHRKPIDFEPVDRLLAQYKRESEDYILGAIEELAKREHRPLLAPEAVQARLTAHRGNVVLDRKKWSERLKAWFQRFLTGTK